MASRKEAYQGDILISSGLKSQLILIKRRVSLCTAYVIGVMKLPHALPDRAVLLMLQVIRLS